MSTQRPPSGLRARQMVKQDQSRKSASYDGYPDASDEPPRVQLILIAIEDAVPKDAERVDTDGLGVSEFAPGLTTDARRRWLASRVVAAHRRLLDRIGPQDEPG